MSAIDGHRVVPLASPENDAQCDALADGLIAGGIHIVEIALRNDFGLAALARLARRGDLTVGAGTVLDAEQARAALDAGAQFFVSPGLSAGVAQVARDAGIDLVPGVMTPTEIMAARDLGLRRLKLFPAKQAGGLPLLDAYAAVFRDVTFMPSGGVTEANLAEHLAHPAVFAASGSWITSAAMLAQGADAIAAAAAAATRAAGPA